MKEIFPTYHSISVNGAQVPGYLVFGTGQPTKEGFEGALKYLLSDETGTEIQGVNSSLKSLFLDQ